MTIKGLLRNNDGSFQLSPKVTTIGKEGCDLTIKTLGVDLQHAVIEYNSLEGCYVLHDLNTLHGTYVNDCRVQNAMIRLASGDVLKFGNSSPYELVIDDLEQTAIPSLYSRPNWSPQQITILHDDGQSSVTSQKSTLPLVPPLLQSTTSIWQTNSHPANYPRPPTTVTSIRSRPLSTSNLSRRLLHNPNASPPTQRAVTGTGWFGRSSSTTSINQQTFIDSNAGLIQEKDQKIRKLEDEVSRLYACEKECHDKDNIIQQLREEIGDLQGDMRQLELSGCSIESSMKKTILLESELRLKCVEIESLRDQIQSMKSINADNYYPPTGLSRRENNDQINEINSLKRELERVKNDKNITSGLVTQMQKEMMSKDTSISCLTREIESLKSDAHNKDSQIVSMQLKFKRVEEGRKVDLELEAKEKEMSHLNLKNMDLEKKLSDQKDLIASLKDEVDKLGAKQKNDNEATKHVKMEMDKVALKANDLERTERQVRVDLEQLTKQLERFRNKVLQATFSTPGIQAPESMLSDEDLLVSLKKVVDERTSFHQNIRDLKKEVADMNTFKSTFTASTKKVTFQLEEAIGRLTSSAITSSKLKQEMDFLNSIAVDDETKPIKENIYKLLEMQWNDVQMSEQSLEQCGINMKISDKSISQNISYLQEKGNNLMEQNVLLENQMKAKVDGFNKDLEQALANLRAELLVEKQEEFEKLKADGDDKLKKIQTESYSESVVKYAALETRNEDQKVEIEKLEVAMNSLKESVLAKDNDSKNYHTAIEEIELMKKTENELRMVLSELESVKMKNSETIGILQNDIKTGQNKIQEKEVEHKNIINQHSNAIRSLEESLDKLVKKNKDYQNEVNSLKKQMHDQKNHHAEIIKSVDVNTFEKTISDLKKENSFFKVQVKEQQDVITNLRKDLASSATRLSDVTGELSEAQKEQAEKYKKEALTKTSDLNEARQKMAILTEIIEKQKMELSVLKKETNQYKEKVATSKSSQDDKTKLIEQLQGQLKIELENNKKKIEVLQEERKITGELSSVGAQCRGERHDKVIIRQREALNELRQRIKILEQTRPAGMTHEQAIHRVHHLTKELADLNDSNKAYMPSSSEISYPANTFSSTQDQNIYEAERSAHKETLNSLEASETSYTTLMQAIAAALDLASLKDSKSMYHLPHDERESLTYERQRNCDTLTNRISVLNERLKRKDELLKGYEEDLTKLRKTEKIAEKRGVQVENLALDVRDKYEETMYLRESLTKTKSELDEEKRLSNSMRLKKSFYYDKDKAYNSDALSKKYDKPGTPNSEKFSKKFDGRKSYTPDKNKKYSNADDVINKGEIRKKAQQEKLRRKNFEISLLKNELQEKDHSLSNAKRKILTFENKNMLINSPRAYQMIET